jgi:GH25 family lysozyme M1 (1,4-beta-N-acetylmuramidase)
MIPIANMPKGIDVSKFQGDINWPLVKDAGISFAFARAIDDKPPGNKIDPKFARNFAGMKDVGIFRGAYYFLRPKRNVAAAANLFNSIIGSLGEGDLPPVIDVESADGVSAAVILDAIARWIDIVEAGLNRQVIIYTFTPFWRDTLGNSTRFRDHPLWIAHFTTAPQPNFPSAFPVFSFWQHTENGRVPGVTPPASAVDLNRFNGSMDGLRAFAGFPRPTAEATTAAQPVAAAARSAVRASAAKKGTAKRSAAKSAKAKKAASKPGTTKKGATKKAAAKMGAAKKAAGKKAAGKKAATKKATAKKAAAKKATKKQGSSKRTTAGRGRKKSSKT